MYTSGSSARQIIHALTKTHFFARKSYMFIHMYSNVSDTHSNFCHFSRFGKRSGAVSPYKVLVPVSIIVNSNKLSICIQMYSSIFQVYDFE